MFHGATARSARKQLAGIFGNRPDFLVGARLGQHLGDGLPVLQDVRHSGWDPDVVLQDAEFAVLVPDQVDTGDHHPRTILRIHPNHLPVEVRGCGDQPAGDDPVGEDLALPVDVGQEGLKGPNPLWHTGFDDPPFGGRDDPGYQIEWEWPLDATEGEGDALVQKRPAHDVRPGLEIGGVQRLERGKHRVVGRPDLSWRGKHFVPCPTERVFLEQIRHGCDRRTAMLRGHEHDCVRRAPPCRNPGELGRCRSARSAQHFRLAGWVGWFGRPATPAPSRGNAAVTEAVVAGDCLLEGRWTIPRSQPGRPIRCCAVCSTKSVKIATTDPVVGCNGSSLHRHQFEETCVSTSGGTRAIIAALLANFGIAVTKFVAFLISGSSSMLAESVHSLADSGNQVLLLIGGKRARREATAEHPFGYGRERYVYAFMVSIILFSVGGVFSIYEGVHKIQHPEPIEVPWLPIAVLLIAIGLESFSLRTALHESAPERRGISILQFVRRAKAPELPVVVLEDIAALVGLDAGVGRCLRRGDHRQRRLRRHRHRLHRVAADRGGASSGYRDQEPAGRRGRDPCR